MKSHVKKNEFLQEVNFSNEFIVKIELFNSKIQ